MPTYASPGVYVEEVPSMMKPIAGVSTSVPAFVAVVPDQFDIPASAAPDPTTHLPVAQKVTFSSPAKNVPVLVTNWTQFATAFGPLVWDDARTDYTKVAATTAVTLEPGHWALAQAVYGFFNNGGSRCYVVRVLTGDPYDATFRALSAIDEISLVVAPGAHDGAHEDLRIAVIAHCQLLQDRFAILDGPPTASDLTTLLATTANKGVAPSSGSYAAWYFPWILVSDPATKFLNPAGDGTAQVPPSGHIAGIYARVDAQRGVHKAPANEPVLGAIGVTQALSKADQDGLNPKGVNCIRSLLNNIVVWGARTIGGDDNADVKYVNVRRTLIYLRESIERGTQWVVFEPNTPALWQRIDRNVTAFLTNVWRAGALFGTTAAQAFYVKCDAETNPPSIRDAGQVVTEVGVAIARPAEFVIFRISQWAGPGQ